MSSVTTTSRNVPNIAVSTDANGVTHATADATVDGQHVVAAVDGSDKDAVVKVARQALNSAVGAHAGQRDSLLPATDEPGVSNAQVSVVSRQTGEGSRSTATFDGQGAQKAREDVSVARSGNGSFTGVATGQNFAADGQGHSKPAGAESVTVSGSSAAAVRRATADVSGATLNQHDAAAIGAGVSSLQVAQSAKQADGSAVAQASYEQLNGRDGGIIGAAQSTPQRTSHSADHALSESLIKANAAATSMQAQDATNATNPAVARFAAAYGKLSHADRSGERGTALYNKALGEFIAARTQDSGGEGALGAAERQELTRQFVQASSVAMAQNGRRTS